MTVSFGVISTIRTVLGASSTGPHQQHFDRQKVDEDQPFVPLTGTVTVMEGEGQILFRWEKGEQRTGDR